MPLGACAGCGADGIEPIGGAAGAAPIGGAAGLAGGGAGALVAAGLAGGELPMLAIGTAARHFGQVINGERRPSGISISSLHLLQKTLAILIFRLSEKISKNQYVKKYKKIKDNISSNDNRWFAEFAEYDRGKWVCRKQRR